MYSLGVVIVSSKVSESLSSLYEEGLESQSLCLV
jgi:hypothetical protein